MTDRLKYLSPTASRQALAAAGVAVREESAFQGGDGYLHFGSPELALATVARIAEHAFAQVPASVDPIYADPDFAVDFFAICGSAMQELVEDPGYAALLGAFGPALLDLTGSRPTARQTELPDEDKISDTGDVESEIAGRLDDGHYRDDILRLLFVCAHPDLPVTRVVVTIEALCDGDSAVRIHSAYASREEIEQVLAMGMEEGITSALGQIDAILAA